MTRSWTNCCPEWPLLKVESCLISKRSCCRRRPVPAALERATRRRRNIRLLHIYNFNRNSRNTPLFREIGGRGTNVLTNLLTNLCGEAGIYMVLKINMWRSIIDITLSYWFPCYSTIFTNPRSFLSFSLFFLLTTCWILNSCLNLKIIRDY